MKYEKLPIFGGNCGLLGRFHQECGDGEHDKACLEWGNFILADVGRCRGRGSGGHGPEGVQDSDGNFGGFTERGRGAGIEDTGCGQGLMGVDVIPTSSWRFNGLLQNNNYDALNNARTECTMKYFGKESC